MNNRSTLLTRIYRLKLLFVGALLVILGLLTSTLAEWMKGLDAPNLVIAVVDGLASVFLVTGAIGIAVDFFTGKDKEAADVERNRQVQKELIPDYVDAVIDAFAFKRDDVARVATPELLDDLATNALALRLGDEQFASELYSEIRDQVIAATERWHDVQVDLRLSSIDERSTSGTPLFDLTVQWEYTVVPRHAVRRFVCTSDRDEMAEIRKDGASTVPWFMTPRKGLDPSSREAFELLAVTIDGEEQSIRRSTRKAGQTYTVVLAPEVLNAQQEVQIKHIYRVRTPAWGHRLFVELPEPARNMSVTMDYTDTTIADMRVSDTVATSRPVRVSRSPEGIAEQSVTVEMLGWLLPRTGTAFTWTLECELPRDVRREAA